MYPDVRHNDPKGGDYPNQSKALFYVTIFKIVKKI